MKQNDSPRGDTLAWINGSDAPEKHILNLGFMPLTDSASLIVAATQGFSQPYGLTLNLRRQQSWSALRDGLLNGELDAAQGLYGLAYSIQLGLGSAPTPMAVLMGLNQNGQSINLSQAMLESGVNSSQALIAQAKHKSRKLCLAHTFPTGTHAMWLYYWLAAHGIHPLKDVDTRVVPPSLMVEHLRAGRIDGFCAGEPWGAHAIQSGMGFTLATSQSVWPDHPVKVLCATQRFVEQYPNTARALIMSILDASRFIEESEDNRCSTAQLISGADYVNAPLTSLQPRMLGNYVDGCDHDWHDAHPLRFHGNGEVNMPYLSDGLWFMTQFRRWGLLREDPDYFVVAKQVQQVDLYKQAANALGISLPTSMLRSSTLMDGKIWDGTNPTAYAHSFDLHAIADPRATRQAN